MPGHSLDWQAKGFAAAPEYTVAAGEGLLLCRCWGDTSSEWGTGFFSLERPGTVMDAELRYNIADWGNGIHFVSTFRLKPGFSCWVGPVAHGPQDLSRAGTQVFVDSPLAPKLELLRSREVLTPDVTVVSRPGHA